jgi:hypothetical protein
MPSLAVTKGRLERNPKPETVAAAPVDCFRKLRREFWGIRKFQRKLDLVHHNIASVVSQTIGIDSTEIEGKNLDERIQINNRHTISRLVQLRFDVMT